MASWEKATWVSFWFLSLCSVSLAGVRRLSCFQVISPYADHGLPKRLNAMIVNDLLLAVYDSDIGKLVSRNGYRTARQFWSESSARYMAWNSWVETEYEGLVQKMNTSSPRAEPYYMQVLKTCELDDDTDAVRAITRYSLNGEDVVWYDAEQNRWFTVHPAASHVAELWNREAKTFGELKVHTEQHCRFTMKITEAFITEKTAQPTARVALVPGIQVRPGRLVCHVTGFYPRDIEVTWERGGQVAQGEQLTSGIRPNGDSTFQIQVSIELGKEGTGPPEHVCVVRHSSLGNTTLRVTWDSQPPGLAGVPWIVVGCILAALVFGALGLLLWKRPVGQEGPYHLAQMQPGTLNSAPATAQSGGGTSCTIITLPDGTE